MTILIANEFGTRELQGEELESYLADKAISDAEALIQLTAQMRNYRNEILMRCDWTELPSAALRLNAAKVTAWATYRQTLRDVTTQTGFPWTITWPDAP